MDDIWEFERRLWLDGASAYSALMADSCVMILGPMGIMGRDAILESIEHAPRWTSVSFDQKTTAPSFSTIVLAYHASAKRADTAEYEALCCSTYVEEGGSWKILAHQQTPL